LVLFGSIISSHSKTINAKVVSFLRLTAVIEKLYIFDA